MFTQKYRLLSMAWLCFALASCQDQRNLPVLAQVPDFSLQDQNGKLRSLQDLQGKIWVANFVFTSCGGTCPMLTRRMMEVQQALLKMNPDPKHLPVRIVSFSVDPERDTPEKLFEYARQYGTHPELWIFLTGSLQDITHTVMNGFKISMGRAPLATSTPSLAEEEGFQILHGEHFVLVDQQGRIRGYYPSERAGIDRLLRDIQWLLHGAHS